MAHQKRVILKETRSSVSEVFFVCEIDIAGVDGMKAAVL